MTQILVIAAAVLVTSFISGIFGMAGGMILMGVLLAFVPVSTAMVLHGVAQLTSNGWRALLWRGYVRWRVVGRFMLGLVAAAIPFAILQFVPNPAIVLLTLGLSPFVVLMIPDRYVLQVDHRFGAELCGFVCTAFQFFSGVSATVLDLFFVRSDMDRRTVVATKAACQVGSHLTKLVYFGGIIGAAGDGTDWLVVVSMMLPAIAGTTLSRAMLERLSDAQFRRWTKLIVAAVGGVYLVRGLSLLAVP